MSTKRGKSKPQCSTCCKYLQSYILIATLLKHLLLVPDLAGLLALVGGLGLKSVKIDITLAAVLLQPPSFSFPIVQMRPVFILYWFEDRLVGG